MSEIVEFLMANPSVVGAISRLIALAKITNPTDPVSVFESACLAAVEALAERKWGKGAGQ